MGLRILCTHVTRALSPAIFSSSSPLSFGVHKLRHLMIDTLGRTQTSVMWVFGLSQGVSVHLGVYRCWEDPCDGMYTFPLVLCPSVRQ